MPLRNSDATAADSDELRLGTTTSQAPNPNDMASSPDSPRQSRTADVRPSNAEKEKETSKPRNSDAVAIEDLHMPRSIITRLAKGVLPPNTQIQGSAITGMSKSATVFISHLANAANTLTTNAGKKTIMPSDVFAALDDIEFGFMREHLEAEFAKFSHIQTSKRSDYRKRVAAAKKASSGEDADSSAVGADAEAEAAQLLTASPPTGKSATTDGSDAPPQAKKAKRTYEAVVAIGGEADDRGGVLAGKTDNDANDVDEEELEMAEEEDDVDEDEEEEGEEEDEADLGDEEEEEEEEEEEVADDMEDREDAADDDEALDSDGSE